MCQEACIPLSIHESSVPNDVRTVKFLTIALLLIVAAHHGSQIQFIPQ